MAPPPRHHRQLPPHLFLPILLLASASSFFFLATPATAQDQSYCRDSLSGLNECDGFMYGGAGSPSPACCAAYEAAFDADPFCLCYVADGTYGRATGLDVDVARALRIPADCGQGQPPVELCNMEGLVLPPYAPQATSQPAQPPSAADADVPDAQPPSTSASGSSSSSSLPEAPPPPPPSSKAPELLPNLIILAAVAIVVMIT